MIFLCNPLINVVDVLPDFIGLLMIMHGLSKVAEVTDHLGDAGMALPSWQSSA